MLSKNIVEISRKFVIMSSHFIFLHTELEKWGAFVIVKLILIQFNPNKKENQVQYKVYL